MKFCKNITNLAKNLFDRHKDSDIEDKIKIALSVTQELQNLVQTNAAENILKLLTKGKSNQVKEKITGILDDLVTKLTTGSHLQQQIADAKTTEEKLKLFIQAMQQYGPERLKMFMDQFAAGIIAGLDDNQLTAQLYEFYLKSCQVMDNDNDLAKDPAPGPDANPGPARNPVPGTGNLQDMIKQLQEMPDAEDNDQVMHIGTISNRVNTLDKKVDLIIKIFSDSAKGHN